MRVGMGYDIHRFDSRRPLKLGGVAIPSGRGLRGHSDADVLLHAIADALFGAIGEPDLGEQFPPTDARYRNAESRTFVEAALRKVQERGFSVGNLDATVIAETPRLGGYKQVMRRSISRLLNVSPSHVSIKAKTTEGFEPRTRGMAAHAVVLLKRTRTHPTLGSARSTSLRAKPLDSVRALAHHTKSRPASPASPASPGSRQGLPAKVGQSVR
jgi:2-C-methyl-D-erythritol 2,4-cyclodiphosphate synthase